MFQCIRMGCLKLTEIKKERKKKKKKKRPILLQRNKITCCYGYDNYENIKWKQEGIKLLNKPPIHCCEYHSFKQTFICLDIRLAAFPTPWQTETLLQFIDLVMQYKEFRFRMICYMYKNATREWKKVKQNKPKKERNKQTNKQASKQTSKQTKSQEQKQNSLSPNFQYFIINNFSL